MLSLVRISREAPVDRTPGGEGCGAREFRLEPCGVALCKLQAGFWMLSCMGCRRVSVGEGQNLAVWQGCHRGRWGREARKHEKGTDGMQGAVREVASRISSSLDQGCGRGRKEITADLDLEPERLSHQERPPHFLASFPTLGRAIPYLASL